MLHIPDNFTSSLWRLRQLRALGMPQSGHLWTFRFPPIVANSVLFSASLPDGREWLFKFSRNSQGRTPHICEREVCVSVLGELLGIPIVRSWLVFTNSVNAPVGPFDPEHIRDRCVAMQILDGPPAIAERELAIDVARADPGLVANLFAFCHWIGDEDRGLSDVLIVNRRFVFIDNGLCGPGTHPAMRGSHPFPEHFTPEQLVKKCYPGKPSFVAFVFRVVGISCVQLAAPSVVDVIERLPDDTVDNVIRESGLPQWISQTLNSRKRTLRRDHGDWLNWAHHACCGVVQIDRQ
jgi:hypothetical protein